MNPTRISLRCSALALLLVGLCPAAFAQAFDAVRLYGATPDRDGGVVGIAAVVSREYQGSNKRRSGVFPALDYQ